MIRTPVLPKITEYLHYKAAKKHIPLSGAFELTPLCNMNCRMCYVRLTKEQQEKSGALHDAADWISLADKCKEAGMLYLLLTGGEPFLYPDFRRIMEELHSKGFIISINSNGTMIDENVMQWLKKCPPVRVNITLYGASDETYARLCRNPHGFTQVMRAIRLLKEAGISIRINCSVTPYNCNDLEKIVEFCKDNRLICVPTAYMFPPLRKDVTSVGYNDRFTAEQAAYYQAKCEQLLSGNERFIEKVEKNEADGLFTDLESDCQTVEGEGLRCKAGKSSFWVTWNGTMMPCGMFPQTEPYLNVFRDSFDECWRVVQEQASAIRLPVECAGCSIKDKCKACAAMVITESGDFSKVPAYRCDMAHLYHQKCMQIVSELQTEGNIHVE